MKMILAHKYKCTGCKTCERACSVGHSPEKTPLSASREKIRPNVEVQKTDIYGYVQIRCRHCTDAACIKACIAGALYKDDEGYTIHDPEKCVGCWMCVMSCPHGAIRQDGKKEKAKKCDLCIDRGRNPRCVEVCPKKVLEFVEVDENRIPITENNVEARVCAGDSK